MKNKILISLFSLQTIFLLLSFTSESEAWPCKDGSGDIVEDIRKVTGFDKVIVKGSGTLHVKQGSTFSCVIKIDDNLVDYIETEVNKSTLIIKPKKDICPNTYEIHVTMPEIEALGVKGSGEIISKGKIKSKDLRLRIDGSGDVKMDIDAEDLALKINGSGDMDLRGSATNVKAEINGSGDISMMDCTSDIVDLVINGSGEAEVHANVELDVVIRGSGDVVYKGTPQELDTKIMGSGELSKLKSP